MLATRRRLDRRWRTRTAPRDLRNLLCLPTNYTTPYGARQSPWRHFSDLLAPGTKPAQIGSRNRTLPALAPTPNARRRVVARRSDAGVTCTGGPPNGREPESRHDQDVRRRHVLVGEPYRRGTRSPA